MDETTDDFFEGFTEGKLIKEDFDEDESEHEECTPKPTPRKRKVEATLKEAINLKRKLAYESSPAHIPSPPTVTSSPRAPTPFVGCKCDELKEELKELKIELKEELKTKLIKELKITIKETQQTHHDSLKKMVKDSKDVKDEEEEKSKVDQNEEKTEVKDSKDVKVEEIEEEKIKVDQKEEKTEKMMAMQVADVAVEDDEKMDDVKVDDVKDAVKMDSVDDLKVKSGEVEKDDSYINPSLSKLPKTNDPMKVNPLQKFEDELLDKVKEWLDDPKTNDVKKDVKTCEVGKDMFVRVLTRLTWLEDTEIDAFCHLLRKRIAEYPKTYKNSKVAIRDYVLADRIRREHKTFSKDRANYPVKEFKDYYMGLKHRYMPEWSTIDDIYVPVNISQKHWILCVARLQKNRIDVYDCDAYIYKNLDPYLKPLCEMIPHVFAKTITTGEMKRYPHFNFQSPIQPITYKRFPHPKVKTAAAKVGEVPRATESGDCGVFTLMYIEYLTANQGVQNVTSENMEFWRQKMAVRLFHQIIEP
ncbi:uncharacterized protein LOC124930081 [Impatiens glandulifera]|uniref:uncharacterized protein LOC124930081 n=1 Tax=Impatiens glandulifera TaxID=253017 RepID=UPI001FB0B81C|nr:uncharacterized protein LOC124930081 [Impatiens glandulifera]